MEAAREHEGAPKRLGDLLVEHGLLNRAQLSEALLQQSTSGKRIGDLLVDLGAIDEEDLVVVLREQLGVPVADLHRQQPQPEALEMIPETVARSMTAIPLRIDGSFLEVAMVDPSHQASIDALRDASGLNIRPLIATPTNIKRVLDTAYRALSGIEAHIQAFADSEQRRRGDKPEVAEVTEDAPIVTIVNLIITQARRDRASDIHLEPTEERVRLRYRIDGALHHVLSFPADMGAALVSRIKILADMNIVEKRRPQDGQFSQEVDGTDLDVRVSTTATIWGEKAVLRLLGKSGTPLSMSDLGMSGVDDESTFGIGAEYRQVIHSPFGMVVVAGPTGSGKTTTLYATLLEINRSDRNVMTIEDPVEYVMPAVNQLQINEAAGVSFASGLKSILRQDPDAIMVGEIRDVETAKLAVQSALTGHFVLSSIHATDAASALHRFIDMGIEPFLVSSTMLAMVSQRLVRRVCKHCKVAYEPTRDEIIFYEQSVGPPREGAEFVRGEGCNFCANTGFLGRIGVFELLRVTDQIKELLMAAPSHEKVRSMAIAQGMVPMRTAAMSLVASGVTTIDEVLRAIYLL